MSEYFEGILERARRLSESGNAFDRSQAKEICFDLIERADQHPEDTEVQQIRREVKALLGRLGVKLD